MIPDLDIYRSAQVLVKRHVEDAPIQAAMRADAMLEAGDLDGYEVSTASQSGRSASRVSEYLHFICFHFSIL